MVTSTTMVFCILVETTCPILVLRRLFCDVAVVSTIYFFLVLVAFLAFLGAAFFAGAFLAIFLAALRLGAAVTAGALAMSMVAVPSVPAATGPVIPNSLWRMMVFTRATSLRRPRSFFKLSVCPILS